MHRITLCFLLSAAVLRGSGTGSENRANSLVRLTPVSPCEALVAAAQTNRIPLEQIDPPTESDRLDPGDSISALITLFEKGGRRRQWLVYLEVVAPNAKESAQKPNPPLVLYSSFGGTQACVSVPAFVVVRTLGPFVDSSQRGTPPEKSARFALNKGFLSLGLHHAAAAFRRFEQGTVRGTWTVGDKPLSDAEIAKGREFAGRLQLTAEEERGMVGSIPALLSYFEVVQNTPGLSDILFDILDLPSAWSLLRNRGIKSVGFHLGKGVAPTEPGLWGLPDSAPAYHFPLILKMNERPALNLTFVVTSPNPPLLACSGVVGLLAEKPGGSEKYLTMRVIGARRMRRT